MGRREDLDHFYTLLHRLEQKIGGRRRLADDGCKEALPHRGVYFFFEPGEFRGDGTTPRVVRVGTHAVSAGAKSTLWSRLRDHRGHVRGSHAGGGNHRASIFRFHVGTALLERGVGTPADHLHWVAQRRPKDERMREAERRIEVAVSQHIRAMPFLWLEVDDPSSKQSNRKLIEANAIGLLSNRGRPGIDTPSPDWMGRWADHPAVRESGLWNVDHVDVAYDPGFLTLLAEYISRH